MDQIEEKSSVLARTGSFYYRSLPEKPKNEANFMSHLTWQTKLFNLGDISQNLLLSGGYYKGNFKVLHFKDQDIDYFGLKSALQQRVMAYTQEEEIIETPLRPKINPEWDYTGIDTVLEVIWNQVDLSDGIIVPAGALSRVDLTVPAGQTSAGYLVLLTEDESGQYGIKTVSEAPGSLRDGKMRWLFKDAQLTGKTTRFIITTSEDEQSARQEITSIVNHLDNDSSVQAGDSVVIGVVPELVFFLRGASVIDNVITARPANLTISAVTGVLNEEGDVVSEDSAVILFPTGNPEDKAIYSDVMRFGLAIDPDLWITSIQTSDKRLIAGYDFFSEFGKLVFPINPAQLFPDMTLMAYSFVKRTRNLYSYSLRLDDVYGPVDRVMHYYRVTQSPRAFYLAAAQAAGFAVVREDCKVIKSLPLFEGRLYITDKGNYEVPYKHTPIPLTAELTGGTVIGGEELFTLVTPGEPLPNAVTSISMDGILPVKGLEAPNSIIPLYNAKGVYNPAYTGPQEALQAYEEYLETYAEQRGEDVPSAWKNYTPEDATNINESITNGFQDLNYVHGEYSWELKVRIDTYSSDFFSTRCIVDIAPDYHFISQAGQFLGLSADSTSMRDGSGIALASEAEIDATGEFVSWPVPTTTENNINTWIASSKLYGWISRTGTGAQGVSDAITMPGALIVLRYDMFTDTFSFEVGNTEQDSPATEVVKITGFNPDPTYMRVQVEAPHSLTGTLLSLRIMKPTEENAITHVRDTVCPNILLIACINYAAIPATMLLRLETFMQRELPVGSVLTTADMPITISEKDTIDV